MLYTDASDTCIGACSTQECKDESEFAPGAKTEKPIYFLSHKLSDSQRKWSVIEKETFAIHYALQKLDHYLHNAQFIIRTDHKPSKYLLNSPMQNKKIQMWALSIAGYNCQIEYVPGPQNVLADLLSRLPDETGMTTTEQREEEIEGNDNAFQIGVINSNEIEPKQFASLTAEDSPKEILEEIQFEVFDVHVEQNKDPDLILIRKQMQAENGPKLVKRRYILIDEVLYFLSHPDDEPKARLVIQKHPVPSVVRQ